MMSEMDIQSDNRIFSKILSIMSIITLSFVIALIVSYSKSTIEHYFLAGVCGLLIYYFVLVLKGDESLFKQGGNN